MAFLPMNLFMVLVLAVFYIWAWDGELFRQLFGIISAIFMLPMWTFPLFFIVDNGTCCTLTSVSNWLPTFMYGNIVLFTMILAYMAVAHVFETIDRDPVGRKRRPRQPGTR